MGETMRTVPSAVSEGPSDGLWLYCLSTLGAVRATLLRRRNSFLAVALILFVGGSLWSAAHLSTTQAELSLWPAVTLFCLLTPLGLLYGAVGLLQLAAIGGHPMTLRDAWRAAGYAQLAEALPLPGGAIVRSAALVQAGSTVARSVALVAGAALLWVALSASAAGLALYDRNPAIGSLMASCGLLVTIGLTTWIAKQAGMRIAGAVFLHRMIGLALMSARMFLAFMVVGEFLPATTACYFAFANIAGSAAAIAPAGLGVGEALAAAMATLIAVPPETAFIAVAINRVISVVSCATLVGISHFLTPKTTGLPFGAYQ